VGVGGNVTGDPRFVDAAGGDFHLRPDSPARAAGLVGFPPVDLEGDPRGQGPDDAQIDIGLDEFYPRYHWFHPRPRLGRTTTCRILGEPGDVALAFASQLEPVGFPFYFFPPVGVGWQLEDLLSPRPFVSAVIGPDGLAEVPLRWPDGLAVRRLSSSILLTQILYVKPGGETEPSANVSVVHLSR
jgi:hypothetical protein